MSSYQEHRVMLYLSKDLYKAFIKLQADKELGRSYAGLLPFVEGLYQLGYISKKVYDTYFSKYSQPLGTKNSESTVQLKKLQDEKVQMDLKDKQFKGQLEQWDLHPNPKWRAKVLADAENWKDRLDSARMLLESVCKQ